LPWAVLLGYRLYSKFIAEKIYQLDSNFETPIGSGEFVMAGSATDSRWAVP